MTDQHTNRGGTADPTADDENDDWNDPPLADGSSDPNDADGMVMAVQLVGVSLWVFAAFLFGVARDYDLALKALAVLAIYTWGVARDRTRVEGD